MSPKRSSSCWQMRWYLFNWMINISKFHTSPLPHYKAWIYDWLRWEIGFTLLNLFLKFYRILNELLMSSCGLMITWLLLLRLKDSCVRCWNLLLHRWVADIRRAFTHRLNHSWTLLVWLITSRWQRWSITMPITILKWLISVCISVIYQILYCLFDIISHWTLSNIISSAVMSLSLLGLGFSQEWVPWSSLLYKPHFLSNIRIVYLRSRRLHICILIINR
jgi:hypothetical protein